MRGWTPNDDGVEHLEDFRVLPEDLECVKAKWAAVNGELTMPDHADPDRCYDAACECMSDVYAGQKRRRTYKSLPEADVWRDEGAGG